MTNKTLYENYLKSTGDIISMEEWLLTEGVGVGVRKKSKLKQMEVYWNVLRRSGLVKLAAYITGDQTIAASASGGFFSVPLSLILYTGYRKSVDICTDKCTNNLCNQKCYLDSCGMIIKEVYDAIRSVRSRKKDKEKALKKLDKELVKWVKRYNTHKAEIARIIRKRERDQKELFDKSEKARERYYSGSVSK
jgi:hypothetical protein